MAQPSSHTSGPTAPNDDLLSTEDFLSLPGTTLAEHGRGRIESTRMGAVELLVLRFDEAVAVVSRFGAQVLTYRPHAAEPDTLFTSSLAHLDGRAAIRGGIPVCWPWFGPAAEPQHGWARLHPWDIEALAVDDAGAEVRLGFAHRGGAAGLTVRLDDALAVELTHRADPDPADTGAAVPVTAALHAYLRTGDPTRTTVEGIGSAPLPIPAAGLDEVHPLTGGSAHRTLTLDDPTLGRRLRIRTDASDAVVWNPGKPLGDTTPDAHRGFLCVEPTRISRPLAPGDTLRMRLTADRPGS